MKKMIALLAFAGVLMTGSVNAGFMKRVRGFFGGKDEIDKAIEEYDKQTGSQMTKEDKKAVKQIAKGLQTDAGRYTAQHLAEEVSDIRVEMAKVDNDFENRAGDPMARAQRNSLIEPLQQKINELEDDIKRVEKGDAPRTEEGNRYYMEALEQAAGSKLVRRSLMGGLGAAAIGGLGALGVAGGRAAVREMVPNVSGAKGKGVARAFGGGVKGRAKRWWGRGKDAMAAYEDAPAWTKSERVPARLRGERLDKFAKQVTPARAAAVGAGLGAGAAAYALSRPGVQRGIGRFARGAADRARSARYAMEDRMAGSGRFARAARAAWGRRKAIGGAILAGGVLAGIGYRYRGPIKRMATKPLADRRLGKNIDYLKHKDDNYEDLHTAMTEAKAAAEADGENAELYKTFEKARNDFDEFVQDIAGKIKEVEADFTDYPELREKHSGGLQEVNQKFEKAIAAADAAAAAAASRAKIRGGMRAATFGKRWLSRARAKLAEREE